MNICKGCGEKFTPKYALDYYCSDECHAEWIEKLREIDREEMKNEG